MPGMKRFYLQFLAAAALAFVAYNVSAEESLLTCDGENVNLLMGSRTKSSFSLEIKKDNAKVVNVRFKHANADLLYTIQGHKCGEIKVCRLIVQPDRLILRMTNQEDSEDYDLVLMNSGEYSGRLNKFNMPHGRCAVSKKLF